MKDKSPCLDCTRRESGCHGRCASYLTFREKWRKLKKVEQEEREKEMDFNSFKIGVVRESKKKSGVN